MSALNALTSKSTGLAVDLAPARRWGAHHTKEVGPNYKWMALFISTLGMLMATIDGSIVLIALPDIFRGIGIDPLAARQHLLPAVDDPRLPGGHQRAGGQPRPAWATSTAGSASTTSASPSSPSSRCC